MRSNKASALARLQNRTIVVRTQPNQQPHPPTGSAQPLTTRQRVVTSSHAPQGVWHPEEKVHRSKERSYWGLSLLLSSAVAIGAFASAYFAHEAVNAGQASADAGQEAASQSKRQADFAQQQLVQSQSSSRPYVIAQISKGQLYQTELGGSGPGSPIYEFSARVRFTNFGTTPAIIKYIDGNVALTLPYNKLEHAEKHVTEMILSQGESTPVFTWSRPTNSAETTNVFVGNGSVYIGGEIDYLDVAGHSMSSSFCYIWPVHSHSPETQLVLAYGPGCTNQSK